MAVWGTAVCTEGTFKIPGAGTNSVCKAVEDACDRSFMSKDRVIVPGRAWPFDLG